MKTVQTILISLFLGIGQTITAQEFIGWRWNHINNIEELRSIDTNTGTTTLLNTIPEIESLSSGVDAIDNNSNKLYLIGRSSGDTSSRLFIINSLTGALFSSVLLDTLVGGIVVNSSGSLIGWRWNHINNIEELRSIDTNTGTTTLLNTIPEIESLSSGVDAIDNNSNKLYLIGRSSGDTSSRLFIINSLTGVLLSSVLLDTSVSGIAAVTISTSVETVNLDLPKSIQLLQNYPNPFNTATTINYKLNKSSFINLSVYNVNGELVETLINERNDVGNHSVEWDAESISSDVYFYRITTGEYTETKKCLLLK